MKKTILCAAALVALFSSCLSPPLVWDPALPEEEMATVFFNGAYPTSYNGVRMTDIRSYIKFPAGEADFVCSVYAFVGKTLYTGEDREWSYTFMGGKSYMISFAISKGLYGVNVYGQSPEESFSIKEENLIEFVPFKTANLSR
jgi:hypothetical protein